MPNRQPSPPKGAGKFAIFAAIILVAVIVITFVGLNTQHAKDLRDQQSGIVKPEATPMTDKDLGKSPTPQN